MAQSALQSLTPGCVVLVHVRLSAPFDCLHGFAYAQEVPETGHRQPFQTIERAIFVFGEFQRVAQRDHPLPPFSNVPPRAPLLPYMPRDLQCISATLQAKAYCLLLVNLSIFGGDVYLNIARGSVAHEGALRIVRKVDQLGHEPAM